MYYQLHTGTEASREHRAEHGEDGLRRVEPHDADAPLPPEPEGEEALGDAAHPLQVLRLRPLLPPPLPLHRQCLLAGALLRDSSEERLEKIDEVGTWL